MDGKTEDGTETYLFSRREFSFAKVLPNGNEVYMRYLSYANKDRFHDDLIKKCPTKIDIGAIYNEQVAYMTLFYNSFPRKKQRIAKMQCINLFGGGGPICNSHPIIKRLAKS